MRSLGCFASASAVLAHDRDEAEADQPDVENEETQGHAKLVASAGSAWRAVSDHPRTDTRERFLILSARSSAVGMMVSVGKSNVISNAKVFKPKGRLNR
jgi:hypothetical protein